jgi:hypothetical protein
MATERVSARTNIVFTSPLKHYTGAWCLFVAALPIIVTQFGLVPVYESQRSLLPAYASFFCLLALAFVFSQRHRMARAMFAPRLLWPDEDGAESKVRRRMSINGALASMIFGALACTALYLWAFEIGRSSPTFPRLPPTSMNAVLLALSFIMLFLLASAAFAVVAVREHIQHVLGLSDAEVITGLPRSAPVGTTATGGAHHTGISAVTDRQPSRMGMLSDEAFAGAEELFKRESPPPLRVGKGDPGRL